MDRVVLTEKLESLRRSISRIEEKYAASKNNLQSDYDAQDIISLNLTRAVQLCVDIAAHIIAETDVTPPVSMSDAFVKLSDLKLIGEALSERIVSAVGFRNLAIHSYEKINWDIVKSLCEYHLSDFKLFSKKIDALL